MKLVSTRLTEGQHILGVLSDNYSKALNLTPADQQIGLKQDFTKLRNEWDQFNVTLNSTLVKLKVSS